MMETEKLYELELEKYQMAKKEIDSNLTGLEEAYNGTIPYNEQMLYELYLYNENLYKIENPYKMSGNFLTAYFNDDTVEEAIKSYPAFVQLLKFINISREYQFASVKERTNILIDIYRHRKIMQIFDNLLKEEREKLETNNVVRRILAK